MPTMLLMYRGSEHRKVVVPHCPMFDFERENDTDEVKALQEEGFRINGHVDDPDVVIP